MEEIPSEKFDERRVNLLKSQVIQLERQVGNQILNLIHVGHQDFFVSMTVSQSVSLLLFFISLVVCLSVCLSVCLHACLFLVRLSVCLSLSVCLLISLPPVTDDPLSRI